MFRQGGGLAGQGYCLEPIGTERPCGADPLPGVQAQQVFQQLDARFVLQVLHRFPELGFVRSILLDVVRKRQLGHARPVFFRGRPAESKDQF